LRFHVRIGHDESDTREKFAGVPFYFTDNPSGLIPFLRSVMKLDHLHLYAAFWGATGGAFQVAMNEPIQAAVAGKPNEVGDALLLAELVQVWTGKGRIPRSQNCLNQDR
jgi:hypothetical protein